VCDAQFPEPPHIQNVAIKYDDFQIPVLSNWFEYKQHKKLRSISSKIPFNIRITKYYSGGQIEKSELDEACSTYGAKEKCIHDFGRET
jgi:hypothetical protein